MMKEDPKNTDTSLKTTKANGIPRRDFFKILGTGIIIFFRPWRVFDVFGVPSEQERTLPTDYNAFLQYR